MGSSLSKKELHFLYQFRKPRSIDEFIQRDVWRLFLNENPKATIKRMYELDLLKRSSYSEYINYSCKVDQLKDLLKEKDLPIKGKKSDLIERLVNADPEGLLAKFGQNRLIQCTDKGIDVVNDYIESEKLREEKALDQYIENIQNKKYVNAIKISDEFKINSVNHNDPRFLEDGGKSLGYMSISLKPQSLQEQALNLELIFNAEPKILLKKGISDLEPYRLLASLSYFPRKYSKTRLKDLNSHCFFDPDTIARMFLFYISHKETLQRYRKNGVKRIQILTAGSESCKECQKLDGKIYQIDKMIELPYENCTCDLGCRCTIVASFL